MTIAAAMTLQARAHAPITALVPSDVIGEGRWDGDAPVVLLRFFGLEAAVDMSEEGSRGPQKQKVAAVAFARTMAEAERIAAAVVELFDMEPFTRDGFRFIPVSQGADPDYNLEGAGDGNSMAVVFQVIRRAL